MYGPVRTVVWEGWSRKAPPYPDLLPVFNRPSGRSCREHWPDTRHLAIARAQGQIIVTADLDFPRLLAIQTAAAPGIVLFRCGSYTDDEMLRLLDRVLAQSNPFDLEHSITVVDRVRVRRHRLPIEK